MKTKNHKRSLLISGAIFSLISSSLFTPPCESVPACGLSPRGAPPSHPPTGRRAIRHTGVFLHSVHCRAFRQPSFHTDLHTPRRGGFGCDILLLDMTTASHAITCRHGDLPARSIVLASSQVVTGSRGLLTLALSLAFSLSSPSWPWCIGLPFRLLLLYCFLSRRVRP